MTKPELLALFRLLSDDVKEPYRLTTAKANLFINEAEREAAERALYLRTDDACYNIKLVASKSTYALSPEIIFVDRVTLSSNGKVLEQTTKSALDSINSGWQSLIGQPVYFIIERLKLTVTPIPYEADTLIIDGSRRPVDEMETPEHLQESLVYWLLYRYYSMADSEIYDKNAASENLRLFASIFGHKRKASFDNAWQNGSKKLTSSSPF